MASQRQYFLPKDVMESQLSHVNLLLAMFPDSSEILDPPSGSFQQLENWVTAADISPPLNIPAAVAVHVTLSIDDSRLHEIELDVLVPLRSEEAAATEAPPLIYRLKQPTWMTKSQTAELSSGMPTQDILAAFEYISLEAPQFIEATQEHSSIGDQGPIDRVWFYFPSLSTRAKRDDLVLNGPSFCLTGFVLAGKPGVLCLEGTSSNIDKYMQYIKTESWGDIPSHQKKVSERYRETENVARVFDNMEEITNAPFMGPKSGQRGNRGDMQSLETWLKTKGLGGAFAKVVF